MKFTLDNIAKSKVAHLNQHLFNKPVEKKRAKYGNKKTVVDDITFDSAKEARRYRELKLLQKAGHIGLLELQVRFPLEVNGKKVATYIADFTYIRKSTGEKIVEDVKSDITRKNRVYRLKKKLMKELLNIEIVEI